TAGGRGTWAADGALAGHHVRAGTRPPRLGSGPRAGGLAAALAAAGTGTRPTGATRPRHALRRGVGVVPRTRSARLATGAPAGATGPRHALRRGVGVVARTRSAGLRGLGTRLGSGLRGRLRRGGGGLGAVLTRSVGCRLLGGSRLRRGPVLVRRLGLTLGRRRVSRRRLGRG